LGHISIIARYISTAFLDVPWTVVRRQRSRYIHNMLVCT